jgi:hypothetical protein
MKIKTFLHKNSVLIGITLSLSAIFIAAMLYPGGTANDPSASGYSFSENYISNLLEYRALNGKENLARPWAMVGAMLMGVTTGLAFLRFGRKVDQKKYAIPLNLFSFALIIVNVFIVVPSLHDLMVTLGSILTLLIFFYATVVLVKSRLTVLKVLSVLCLVFFYGAAFMYYSRTALAYMPIVQKLIHVLQIIFILGIDYYTAKPDFAQVKSPQLA